MARLCLTLGAPTMEALLRLRDTAGEGDLLELRLDTVADPDPAAALAGRSRPAIVTCRAAWEGGHFKGSEEERHAILRAAWDLGAEFVDVEHAAAGVDWVRATGGRRLIVSRHDFEGTPDDLPGLYRAMRETGADVVKIATTAGRLADLVPLAAVARTHADQRHVLLAMGVPGWLTRLHPHRFGSLWTYAGGQFAPGQLPASRLLDEFRFRGVGPATRLFGLIANPVGHSVSPAMHNAAFAALGIDAIYVPLQAADASDVLESAVPLGLEGASVTTPFKVDLLPHVDADDVARRAGAVNTLVRRGDGWAGFNSDVEGFLTPLRPRLALRGARAAILGGGGAARAAALALVGEGSRVTVHARRVEQSDAVAAATGAEAGPAVPEAGSWDLLVNATTAGMHPRVDETPLAGGRFDGRLVYDLVYNPPDTRLLREARAAGCGTLGGLDMLVAQACRQFALWTGQDAPADVMRRAALARLAAQAAEPVHS